MNELFDNIKEGNKLKLLQFIRANTLSFKKGRLDISYVNQENIICIVKEGYLQIIRNDINGNTTIIEELHQNDIFGTMTNSIYGEDYEIICKEDSKIIIIDFDTILSYDELKPFYNQFLKNLLKILSNKIIENNERIEILTNKTIREKLLAYFRILSKKNNSSIIHLPFNYTITSDYLAINRSAMSRELKNLKDEGLIEIKGKTIYLLYDRF